MCQVIKALHFLISLSFCSLTFLSSVEAGHKKRKGKRETSNRNMCNKNGSVKPRKAKAPPNPARKSRTKTRKPKYLSLKLQLSHHHQNKTEKNKMPHKQQQQKQLINLFPLHPENLVQDHKDHMQEQHDDQVSDHVAFLFETATDDTSTSLHAILDSTTTTTTTTTTTSEEGSPLSPSLTYVYRGHDHGEREGSSLVKTAMKCQERDASKERWVSYWEVVEKKEQEEVSSNCRYTAADSLEKMVVRQQQAVGDDHNNKIMGLVGLKLDYQEILNAWSDKGPLYIKGESPQTVPDLLDASNALVNIWTVPELGSSSSIKEEKEEWKLGQREASVLRYKEKRQSRLFSKRIRYEVRKLNAEKRPRLKGRFVKRNGEE
ncbi:uncharacterized protein LOC8260335 [Ricinus communis]|uniref:uncharacterized protein LOC8260335 n=1 Tax=Ricinus communis TaxID=3988 RepID=UPI000772B3D6|nr:uncharacterized protein LOC8260335 [Ricinus communis]|eukprot:XP_015579515.1 uncharacterized protein LOC8260335 [Ricinus communis]